MKHLTMIAAVGATALRMSFRDAAKDDKDDKEKQAREARDRAEETRREAEKKVREKAEKDEAERVAQQQAEERARKAEKDRREAAAAVAEDDAEMVMVTVPKPFNITLDNHKRVHVKAGTYPLAVGLAEHWYAKANGVKPALHDVAKADELTPEVYERAAAQVASGDPQYSRDYVVGSMSAHYKVHRDVVGKEIDERVSRITSR
jgi:ATPase subunit of ABC transporter with duplicated ATPase domains